MARALLCRKVCLSHRAPRAGLCFGGLAEPLAAASVAVATDDARCVALGGYALRLGVRAVVRAAARDAAASNSQNRPELELRVRPQRG